MTNLLFIRAAVAALPQALTGVADEIYVLYPWGSLLEAVWTPKPDRLRAIGQLAKPAGRLEVHINTSAIGAERATRVEWARGAGSGHADALAAGYAAAGIRFDGVTLDGAVARTSWAGRLAHGRNPRIIVLRGTVHGDSGCHPQG